jgi:type VI secretion system protein ImpF
MASVTAKDRLQPALFDRLEDDLGSALALLMDNRARLDRRLSAEQKAALETLLADDRLVTRPPGEQELAPFATLEPDDKELLNRVIELERARQMELRRTFVISTQQLRQSVLRDLHSLFNTTNWEHETADEDGGAPVAIFAGLPHARDSVVNFGIPPLSGRVRTPDDLVELARAMERAIGRFEPRVRNARVTIEHSFEGGAAVLAGPVAFLVEGELWGYPFAESLRVRTVLDLDASHLEIADAG